MSTLNNLPISTVDVDFVVLLKIVKHCEQEIVGLGDIVQGFLMGLKINDKLIVTNSFQNSKNSDTSEEGTTQLELMKNLLKLRHDTLQVGWYQNTPLGNFLNSDFIENLYIYQTTIAESIVLIFDNLKIVRGYPLLRAFKLSSKGMQFWSECNGDFSPEKIQKVKINFDSFFQELPVSIRTSNLSNVLLSQMGHNLKLENNLDSYKILDLDTAPVLDHSLRTLMMNIDDLNQENYKLIMYHRQNAKILNQKQQYLAKKEAENKIRESNGLPSLPDEDVDKIFKPMMPPQRLDSLMMCDQIFESMNNLNRYIAQGMGKLVVAEALDKS